MRSRTALPLTRLSLRQMLLLSVLDDSGSLKRAAVTIGMSQPRATKSLQEIEGLMGHALFQRTNRGLNATPAGLCAIRHAKTIMSQLGALDEELGHLSEGVFGRLRVGTIMGAVPFVNDAIQRFLQRFPQTSFEILEDTSAELLRQLDRGQLDLVIGRSSVSSTPEIYNVTAFHDELLAVVANPAHPLVGRKRVTIADFGESRWIVYTAGMPMRLSLEQEYRQAGLAFPRRLFETRSAFTTMALIQAHADAVALLSSDVAAFFANIGLARILPMRLRSKSEAYEVITRRSAEPTGEARQFIAELVSGELSTWRGPVGLPADTDP
ncbi:LysR family transcriptional regulator [Paenirhodobacter sp.]|uniref:LysR family transcriptional regulator n=1 Tax=Paenirhodobacter sp. TaxID=1965326 RepID=UPI003B3D50E0